MPQQVGRGDRIAFRIKLHIYQRCFEGSNKPKARDPTENEPVLTELFEGFFIVLGQQWPAERSGALGAANMGHKTCSISPLGGGLH